jgi:hypothetical protein
VGLVSVGNPFPIRDQLAEGPGAQNARMDCVFDSFAACVEQQTGAVYSGDQIVDYVKGPTYQGGGNAAWLQGDVARHFGVQIQPSAFTDQHRLIAGVRDYLQQRIPTLVTIPSRWNSQPTLAGYTPLTPTFSTHVCAAYAIEESLDPNGEAWLMNPWPESYFIDGHRQQVTVGWLTSRLCYGAIWPVQALPSEWHDVAAMPGWEDDGKQLRRKGGRFVVIKGFRKFCLLHPELFTGVLAGNEPEENEKASATSSTQTFSLMRLIWTPAGGVGLLPNDVGTNAAA